MLSRIASSILQVPRLVLLFLVSAAVICVLLVVDPAGVVDYKIDAVRLGDLPSLQIALELWRADGHGSYPARLDDLVGVEVAELKRDPWGSPYVYERRDATHYLLRSAGANGVDEHGGGDDVTTWPKTYDCKVYGVDCGPTLSQIVGVTALLLAVTSLLAMIAIAVFGSARVIARRIARNA